MHLLARILVKSSNNFLFRLATLFGALLIKPKKVEISRTAYKIQKDINNIVQMMIDEGESFCDLVS